MLSIVLFLFRLQKKATVRRLVYKNFHICHIYDAVNNFLSSTCFLAKSKQIECVPILNEINWKNCLGYFWTNLLLNSIINFQFYKAFSTFHFLNHHALSGLREVMLFGLVKRLCDLFHFSSFSYKFLVTQCLLLVE